MAIKFVALDVWREQSASTDAEVFVIGGAKVYEALLPRCQRLILTYIPRPYEGDTFFQWCHVHLVFA